MNIAGYNDPVKSYDGHRNIPLDPLRAKVREHFCKYINAGFVLDFYNEIRDDEDHVVDWRNAGRADGLLIIADDFPQILEGKLSYLSKRAYSIIRNLLEFREGTVFDSFYESIGGEYKAVCETVASRVVGKKILETLAEVFGYTKVSDGVVVPMPLRNPHGGNHIAEAGKEVAILGPNEVDGKPTFDSYRITTVAAHEFLHSYIDDLKEKVRVALYDYDASQLDEIRFRSYKGITAVEELFMRAFQIIEINPHIISEQEAAAEYEKEKRICPDIRVFEQEIKNRGQKSLVDVAIAAMERRGWVRKK